MMSEADIFFEVMTAAVNGMLAIADAELSDADMKELVFKNRRVNICNEKIYNRGSTYEKCNIYS